MRALKAAGEAQTGHGRLAPPVDAVRDELGRVLAAKGFLGSERTSRFLRFLVERALEGAGNKLDEHLLATVIFNRKSSFDPGTDPIVRVEAGRLRRKLEAYYQTDGANDPVLIELPPRSYVTVFRERPSAPVRPTRFRSWLRVGSRWRPWVLAAAPGIAIGFLAIWAVRGPGWNPTADPSGPDAGGAESGSYTDARSVVVLPFEDLSPSRDQEYFCDGLTEELTDAFVGVGGLEVVARTTSFLFKGRPYDVREIGRQLGVTLALEGSVRKEGNRLRISSQLIDAANGYTIWSRVYDREVREIIEIQEEIARDIAAVLGAGFPEGRWRPADRTRPSSEAYDLYLKALHSARLGSTDATTQAARDLEHAIAIDPSFASAHAALAQCYATLGVHSDLAPGDVMLRAKAAAARALELDDSLARAHATLGVVQAVYDWDWAAAERSFRRSLELKSAGTDVDEMRVMSYLVPQGRLDEALQEVLEAKSRDSLDPRIELALGLVYYYRREYDLAIGQFRAAAEPESHLAAIHLALSSSYAEKSMYAEALATVEEGHAAWDSVSSTTAQAYIHGLSGEKAEAERLIEGLLLLSRTRYVSPAFIARIYAGLGDRDRTIGWLEKAVDVRAASLVFLNVNPVYDSLRSDPRFRALLSRMNLTPE